MKKRILLCSLAFLTGSCSSLNNVTFNVQDNNPLEFGGSPKNSVISEEVTYLPVDGEGNFTLVDSSKENVTDIKTFIKGRTDTFWTTRSYCALDSFFDSINNNGEEWTGTFKSKSFVQNKDYIYFTLGGSAANKVILFDDSTNAEIATLQNKYFYDPSASCNMLIYSIEIPEASKGKNMHIEVKDLTTTGFGGVTFGDLHVNQTEEDVAKAYSIYLNNLNYSSIAAKDAENNKIAHDYITKLYANSANEDLYKFYNYSLTNANVTFDQGNDNLSTLAFDSEYAENLGTFLFDSFISSDTAYDWDEQMPFNNDGYFFNGNGYLSRNENAKFRFLTNKFTLSGTGLISIKMAGRSAQLQVLDPTKVGTKDDPVLKTLDVQDFADAGVGNVYLNGANYNTLHRVYWDLSEYLGQEIVLAIADKDTDGNWGMLFFDDLITKYDELPSFTVDVFEQTHKESDVTYYGAFTDLYVKSDETKFNETFNEAYTFLSEHYCKTASLVGDKKHNYLASRTSDEAKATRDAYSLLSSDAKTIVDTSDDFYFSTEGDNWQNSEPTVVKVKDQLFSSFVANVEDCSTKAKLSYRYLATTTDETTTYEISDVALRFGGYILKDDYDAIKDSVVSYGVYLSVNLPTGYTNLLSALKGGATFDGETLNKNETTVEKEGHPYLASSADKVSNDQNEDYYLFNAYLKVAEENYAKTVYSVSFLTLEGGKTIYLQERKASVASLAQEYLNDTSISKDDGVNETLEMLAKAM